MTESPDSSLSPEPARPVWPLAILLGFLNLVFSYFLLGVTGLGAAILAPFVVEPILGLLLLRNSPREGKILLLAPLITLALLAGLSVLLLSICSRMKF